MMKAIRSTLVVMAVLLILLVVTALTLASFTLETRPLVQERAEVDHVTVATGKAVLKRLLRKVEVAGDQGTTLAVTEAEFGHLAQMGSHTFDRLDTEVDVVPESINARISLRVFPNPLGQYLNLVFEFGQSDAALRIDRWSIGRLRMPGGWLLPLAARLIDTLLPDKQASVLLASVRGFRIEGDTALFRVQPPPNVKAELKQIVKSVQATRFPKDEPRRVLHYYELLAAMGEQGRRRRRSLSEFITPLMEAASARREDTSAVAENRAVIWALAIYFSYGGMETLVGDLVSSQRKLVFPAYNVTLSGRRDLMAHFIYSAGITLATEQGIGVAAGEFKELLDSGDGGSGFSFADLAADRAGIRFVEAATSREPTARRLQESLVANPGEAAFFPDIAGLDEGLGAKQLRENYGSLQSDKYQRQVELIDRRIDKLLIYQARGTAPR